MAAYLKDRRDSGAKPSTLKVVAAAIARSHREAGFDVSGQQGATRAVLEELTQDDSPGTTRALPLDLDCYLSIRKVDKEQPSGRGGHDGTGVQRPPAGGPGLGNDRPYAGRPAPGVKSAETMGHRRGVIVYHCRDDRRQ